MRERLWMLFTWIFVKPLALFPHSILLEKLAAYGLDRGTVYWVKNWLNVWGQRIVGNGAKSR